MATQTTTGMTITGVEGLANGARFQSDFVFLQPHILSEFPTVEESALEKTGGDLNKVVALIAGETLHTRTYVRHRLASVTDEVEVSESEALSEHREDVETTRRHRYVLAGVIAGGLFLAVAAVLAVVFAPRMPESVRGPLLTTRRRIPELGGAARDGAVALWEHLPEWGEAAREGAHDLWERRPWA